MKEKITFSQVIWDILAMNLAMMLATVNTLTYAFMIAAIILLYPVYKDLSKYKKAEDYEGKKYKLLIVLALVSTITLAVLISLVVTNNIILTYTVYGLASPVLLITLIFAGKDSINKRKLKENEPKNDENKTEPDFTVEELGTSVDREKTNKGKEENDKPFNE